MNDNTLNPMVVRQIRELRKKRAKILTLPAEEMIDKILSEKNPLPLVHSFPEEDFYFLIHEIGPEDALPVLAMASHRQVTFLLDQEIWEKDRINLNVMSRWIRYMIEADTARFIPWLMYEKIDLLEYFLCHTVELIIREHDQDPSDFGEEFDSFDDVFYFKIIAPERGLKEIEETESSSEDELHTFSHKELIHKLLDKMAKEDHLFYQKLLLESTLLLPAEAEEEAYRWRNIRLSEKGFLPFDEAIGIYQPLTIEQVLPLKRKIETSPQLTEDIISSPDSPFELLKKQKLYSQALVVIDKEEQVHQLQQEFAVLCNQIIVADQALVKNRNDLAAIVKKACGYIQIGLEKLSQEQTDARFSELILNYPLSSFFHLGFGSALKIKWHAEKWIKNSWFKHHQLPLSFWGENWLGVLGGVLIKKPLYFDNYKNGVLYREFEAIDEIEQTDGVINDIIITDKLLALMDVSPETGMQNKKHTGYISYKNFILTLWTRNYLELSQAVKPIDVKQFEPFYKALWEKNKKPGKISETMKTGFLDYLSQKTGLKEYEITDQMGNVLESLFTEIEEEYGRVSFGNLQPAYVHHFLLK